MLLSQQILFVLPLLVTCSGHSDILEHLNPQFWKSKPKHLASFDKTDKIIVVDGSVSVNFNIKYHNGMNFTKVWPLTKCFVNFYCTKTCTYYKRWSEGWTVNLRVSHKKSAQLGVRQHAVIIPFNPLNAELNPICHLLALLGGATIVVVSRLRVKCRIKSHLPFAGLIRSSPYSPR
jgi:hypothetical protein